MKRRRSTLKKYRDKSKIKSKRTKKNKRTRKIRKIRKSRKVRKSRKNKMKGSGVGSSCEACNQGDDIPRDIPKKRSYNHSQNRRNLELESKMAKQRADEERIMKRNQNLEQQNFNKNRLLAADAYAESKFGRNLKASPASSRRQDESPEIRGRSNSYSGSSSSGKISNIELKNKNDITDVDQETTDIGGLEGIERERLGIGKSKRDAKFIADTAPPKMDEDYGPKDSSEYSSEYSSGYSSGYSYLDESDEEAIKFYN